MSRPLVSWFALLSLGCVPDQALDVTRVPTMPSMSTAAPLPPPGLMELVVSPLVIGQEAVLQVTGVAPGTPVAFLSGSALGAGLCPPPLGGACLGVLNPAPVAFAGADAQGIATVRYPVPGAAIPGTVMAFQAVVLGGSFTLTAPASSVVTGDTCAALSGGGWPATSADWECSVHTVINNHRATGAWCGANGWFPPTAPLSLDAAVIEAARVHTEWMADTDSFTHDSPGGPLGDSLGERLTNAGYNWSAAAENIASGYSTPEGVVDGWLASDGHCRNLMNSTYTDAGYGYVLDVGGPHLWTGNFADD